MSLPESFRKDGEDERQRLGIDGTQGDAHDVDHPFNQSVHGAYCATCGLNQSYRRHAALTEQETE